MPYFKNYRIQVLYVFLLILPIIGIAGPGGWVSSGGEIFKNAKNPWFVKNTQVVHYCLEYSESEMTLKSSDTQNLIEQALLYWKNEFNEISPIGSGYSLTQKANQAQIANQNFTKDETCNKDSDLIFKFGYSKLNQEEIDYLKDPQKFLGVTIRKVYDEENLKGKGVIFISGDLGSHSYKKTSADVIDQAWKYPKLLQYVLIHELGHVFGLPHSGSGLMSEVFLDQLLIQKIAALYVREPLMPFIKAVDTATICDNSVLPIGTQSFVADRKSVV